MKVGLAATSRLREGKRQGMSVSSKLMADYLVRKYEEVTIVDHPIKTDPDLSPVMSEYESGRLRRTERLPMYLPRFMLKSIDLLSSLWFAQRKDIFVAGESVNGLAGLLFKKAGLVDTLVYMPGDYWLGLKGNAVKVKLFKALDNLIANGSDVILNTTEEDAKLRKGRPKMFNIPSLCPPIAGENFRPRSNHDIVYLGALDQRFGVDRLIEAMPLVQEEVTDAWLHIIGSGPKRKELQIQADGNASFYGFLDDEKAAILLREMRVGVAPYLLDKTMKTVDSGKIRHYAWSGIPCVVSMEAPEVVKVVDKFQCGKACPPTPEEIAKALIFMLTDDEAYLHAMKGCRDLAEFYDSERYFDGLFAMLEGKPYSAATNFGTDKVTIFSK